MTATNQSLHMNCFIITATLPDCKPVSVKVFAIDKQGAKKSIWHCSPHAVIHSVKSV